MAASMMNPGARIISIDDNEDDTVLLEHLLNRAGVPQPLLSFRSAEDATVWLTECFAADRMEKIPELIFLDVQMGGMGGLEMLKWIRCRKFLGGTAVIMLSTSNATPDVERAHAFGAQCYLRKHPSPDDLKKVISDAVSFAREPATRSALFRGDFNLIVPAVGL